MKKERLSVQVFGKTTFYTGLALGVASTIILYLFFTYLREILRMQTFYKDLLILTSSEFIGYNLFYSALSSTVGFGHAIWFWFYNPFSLKLSRRWVQYIRTYTLFWLIILLLLVFRMGTILFFALYNVEEYENHLSLYRDLPLLMILFPLVFFLNLWVPIRLKYSVGNWFWISFLVYCTVTVILGLASPIDQEHMNEAWRRHNAPYDAIVHQELKRAHDNGIRITPDAAGTLKLKYRQSVHDLARSLKERFKSEKPVSADSVVMELILLKRGTIWRLIPSDWDDPEDLWPFVLPRDVYHQIQLSSDPVKTAYLRELLLEFKSIFRPEDPWEAPGEALEYNYHHRQFMQDLYPEIEAETKKYLHLLEEK